MAFSYSIGCNNTENDIHAADCGLLSMIAAELIDRVKDKTDGQDIESLTFLESVENEFHTEAETTSDQWSDLVTFAPSDMSTDQLVKTALWAMEQMPVSCPLEYRSRMEAIGDR